MSYIENDSMNSRIAKWIITQTELLTARKTRLSEGRDNNILLLEELPDIVVIHVGGRVAYVNKALYRILGYTKDEVLGRTLENFLAFPYDGEVRTEKDEETDLPRREIQLKDRAGKRKILEIRTVPTLFRGKQGELIVLTDKTRQRQAERERLSAEERYNILADKSGLYISESDASGTFSYVNSQYELAGYTAEDLSGTRIGDYLHPEDLGQISRIMKRFFETKKQLQFRYRVRFKSGEYRWMESWAIPFTSETGEDRALIRSRDMTEEIGHEEEALKAQKLESMSLLAGGIAHDFNNLLTGIIGNIMLARGLAGSSAEYQEILKDAEKAAQRASELTLQLLAFSRGGMPVKRAVSIVELTDECARFSLRGSNVAHTITSAPDLWPVAVDKGQMIQVLQNLIINAQQSMRTGGTIAITLRNREIAQHEDSMLEEGRYITLSVKDSGCGIPEEVRPRIFDPYFTMKPEGTGLGLSIAYSVVKKHGGKIELFTEKDKGSEFVIFMPADGEYEKEPEERVRGIEETGKRERILIMDDEELTREVAGKMLTRAGYEVVLTKNGEEALNRYTEAQKSQKPFSLVMLDLTIPGGMGGKEVMARLLAVNRSVKGIVSSGYSNDPVMANYQAFGFAGVLPKPYEMQELYSVVRSALDPVP
jgi:PAS domain S-box-containing protein